MGFLLKNYVYNQYIFDTDTIRVIKQKICTGVQADTKFNKANIQAKRALSLAKSILSGNSTSFVSNLSEEDNSKSS